MMRLTGDPMGRMQALMCCALLGSVASMAARSQTPRPAAVALYDGARLIVGDGRVIDAAAFIVRDGRIAAVGRHGAVSAPAGAARIDLAGKTVMPALINAHVHIGYEGYTTWGAENY